MSVPPHARRRPGIKEDTPYQSRVKQLIAASGLGDYYKPLAENQTHSEVMLSAMVYTNASDLLKVLYNETLLSTAKRRVTLEGITERAATEIRAVLENMARDAKGLSAAIASFADLAKATLATEATNEAADALPKLLAIEIKTTGSLQGYYWKSSTFIADCSKLDAWRIFTPSPLANQWQKSRRRMY